MSICNIYLFPVLVLRAGFAFWLLQFLFNAFLLLFCKGYRVAFFFKSLLPQFTICSICYLSICCFICLSFLLDNIYIRFGTLLYRQIVGTPMGINCAPLVADLFLFCYEGDFMKDFSNEKQADIIKAFNSTSRYLDDLLFTLSILILKEWSTKFIHLNCNWI